MKVLNMQKDSKFVDRFMGSVKPEPCSAESDSVSAAAATAPSDAVCSVQVADRTQKLPKLEKSRKKKNKAAKSKKA
jgi:hypothetical protein